MGVPIKSWKMKKYDNLYHRVSEWLLLNANSAMFQLYHGENNVYSMSW
jgi:hypothetical protein